MIKLIASDVDGTLLQKGRSVLTEEQLTLIRDMIRQNIRFAVASGRQHASLAHLFAPLGEDIFFLSENGAMVTKGGQRLFSREIPRALGQEVIDTIQLHGDHEVMLCGAKSCYIRPSKAEPSLANVLESLHNRVTVVEDFETVDDLWLKISAYVPTMNAADAAPAYVERFSQRLYVALAGQEWVDFTSASKGTALRFLQRHYGINRNETMVFGDNFNDVEMFRTAACSYAMSGADPRVQGFSSGVSDTVEDVLRELVTSR